MLNDSSFDTEKTVSIIFTSCPLDLAARQLSAASSLSIVVPSDAATITVSGSFKDQPVGLVVDSIARALDLKVRWISDDFVTLYRSENENNLILISPAPFVESDKLPTFDGVSATFQGGFLIVSGERELIRQYIKSVQELNKRLTVAFGCEMVLVRVSQRVYLDAAAQFQFNAVNLLAVSDVAQLINIFARLDANFSKSKQVINAFSYLSEGQKSIIEVGTVRQRELKHISNEGYVSTSGYQEFKDGLQVELVCNSLSDSLFCLSSDITNSKYRDSSDPADVLPINDTSKVKSAKAIVSDNHYALLASVSERLDGNGSELFGFTSSDNETVLLVFVRVKRVNPSCFGLSLIDKIDIDSL